MALSKLQAERLLGLKKRWSREDLRRAFKAKALEWHPDKNKNSPEAAAKFLKLREAYDVLANFEAYSTDTSSTRVLDEEAAEILFMSGKISALQTKDQPAILHYSNRYEFMLRGMEQTNHTQASSRKMGAQGPTYGDQPTPSADNCQGGSSGSSGRTTSSQAPVPPVRTSTEASSTPLTHPQWQEPSTPACPQTDKIPRRPPRQATQCGSVPSSGDYLYAKFWHDCGYEQHYSHGSGSEAGPHADCRADSTAAHGQTDKHDPDNVEACQRGDGDECVGAATETRHKRWTAIGDRMRQFGGRALRIGLQVLVVQLVFSTLTAGDTRTLRL